MIECLPVNPANLVRFLAGAGKKICSTTRVLTKTKQFSYFSTQLNVVGTQKNRLNETVQLSTKTNVKTD